MKTSKKQPSPLVGEVERASEKYILPMVYFRLPVLGDTRSRWGRNVPNIQDQASLATGEQSTNKGSKRLRGLNQKKPKLTV